MILREQFEKYKYRSILDRTTAQELHLYVKCFFEEDNQKTEELVDIYISEHGDELFIILDAGQRTKVDDIIKKWDKRVSTFVTFGSDDRALLHRFKYNIIQIILYQNKAIDRSEEGSLNNTRKIFLPYDLKDGEFDIPDTEAIEIPFYTIVPEVAANNEYNIKKLKENMPDENLSFMFERRKKVQDRKKNGVTPRTFSDEQYSIIEEWLKNVYQKS